MTKNWLDFVEIKDTGKTKVWNIHNSDNGSYLGQVKWNGGWRQYIFSTEPDCIWNTDCLDQLNAFIRLQMQERRNAKNSAPQEARTTSDIWGVV